MKSFNRLSLPLRLVIASIAFIVATPIFYNNLIPVAPQPFFDTIQLDSESLVLGKIIADERGWPIYEGMNLGYVSDNPFSYPPDYSLRAKRLLPINGPRNGVGTLSDTTDPSWQNGMGRKTATLLLAYPFPDPPVVKGQTARLWDGLRRTVTGTWNTGANLIVYLEGAPLDGAYFGYPNKVEFSTFGKDETWPILTPYRSQIGTQGVVFSWLYRHYFHSLEPLYAINAALLSLVLIVLAWQYSRFVNSRFAYIFYLSVIMSPWVVAFARNLYWVPFTWFLPACFTIPYLKARSIPERWWWLGLMLAAFALKCSAGYEYISTIILFAAAPLVVLFLKARSMKQAFHHAREFLMVCVSGVAGFSLSLLIHATMRGHTLFEGLRSIYEMDAKRRTYGNPNDFSSESFAALSSSPVDVVMTYIIGWKRDFLAWLPGSFFLAFLTIALATVVLQFLRKKPRRMTNAALLLGFGIAPLSWFVLAKGHSGVHTHINFVLWSFGFSAAILYVSLDGVMMAVRAIRRDIRRAQRRIPEL